MMFVKWFNNSKLMQFLFTPLRYKRFWRTAQRTRFCEECFQFSYNIHWCKDDKEIAVLYCSGCPAIVKTKYEHTYKCDYCLLGIKHEIVKVS